MHDIPAPTYAPLPTAVFQHLFTRRLRGLTTDQWVTDAINAFLEDIPRVRQIVYQHLRNGPHSADGIRTGVLEDRLATLPEVPVTNRNPRQLIATWRKHGILTPRQGPLSTLESVAALLMARLLLPHQQRGWLPAQIPPEAPRWWCWRQDGAEGTPIPCPIPLSADLPPTTLLWTPWAGVVWDDATWWTVASDTTDLPAGAVRWGNAPSIDDLKAWNPAIDDLPVDSVAQTVAVALGQERLHGEE